MTPRKNMKLSETFKKKRRKIIILMSVYFEKKIYFSARIFQRLPYFFQWYLKLMTNEKCDPKQDLR